jgi:hypothetical protein
VKAKAGTGTQSRQGEAETGTQSRFPSPKPSRPTELLQSSGSLSAALWDLFVSPCLRLVPRRRRNAPLDNEQTLRAATTSPHRLQGHEYEGLSRADQSAKLALTTNAQNRALPSRTSTQVRKPKTRQAHRQDALINVASAIIAPVAIGSRKSREAGRQPRTPKSVNASSVTKSRSHAHNDWRTASWASQWHVRTCGTQAVFVQKAARPRSVLVEGRGAKPASSRDAQSR